MTNHTATNGDTTVAIIVVAENEVDETLAGAIAAAIEGGYSVLTTFKTDNGSATAIVLGVTVA